ncbi:hypothetical protein K438DRAFT_1751940 [Mycena galopus ATCC 62051]|nr:hypothetical protein K438DRAFT_1751940 [Mycena galopus ATCC 62051]
MHKKTNRLPASPRFTLFLLLPPSLHNMHTLSQLLTFLKVYFRDSLSRLMDLPDHVEFAASSISPDKVQRKVRFCLCVAPLFMLLMDTQATEFLALTPEPKPEPEPEPESTSDNNKLNGKDSLCTAVDKDLNAFLPSSNFPPHDLRSTSSPRVFGDVTNFREFEQAKGMKLNTELKLLVPSSPLLRLLLLDHLPSPNPLPPLSDLFPLPTHNYEVPKQAVRKFSAIALEEGRNEDVFIIGEDEKEEDENTRRRPTRVKSRTCAISPLSSPGALALYPPFPPPG